MSHRCTGFAIAMTLSLALIGHARAAQDPPPAAPAVRDLSGLHAFDVMQGEWKTRHRRLKERLAGSSEWIAFTGDYSLRTIMGGWSNVSDNAFEIPGGGSYRGVSLRSYDASDGHWNVWWMDSRNPSAPLDPPVRGHFVDGIATFYSDDSFRGQPIRVRVRWSNMSATSARWEQAFSADGGKTWETNWITDYERKH